MLLTSCSLDVNKANGMLTSNAKRIFCDNVTCFGTSKSCSNRSHLSGSFKCSSLISCKAPRVRLRTAFNLCQLVFPAYTLQCPSICVLLTAFRTFCLNKLEILTGTSWDFSDKSSDICAPPAHESTPLNVRKANGMETSHAKRIFSDNVTCFGTNKRCSNRSHLQKCFIKALRFLLAWFHCFYTENPRFFVLEGDIRNTPDCPGRNNSHFALENED